MRVVRGRPYCVCAWDVRSLVGAHTKKKTLMGGVQTQRAEGVRDVRVPSPVVAISTSIQTGEMGNVGERCNGREMERIEATRLIAVATTVEQRVGTEYTL